MSTSAKPRAACRNGSACTFGAKCKFYHGPEDSFGSTVPGGPAPSHRRSQRIDLGPTGAVSVKSTYATAVTAPTAPAPRAPFQEPLLRSPPRSPPVSPKPDIVKMLLKAQDDFLQKQKAAAPVRVLTQEEAEVAKIRVMLPLVGNWVGRKNLLGEHLYPKIHTALKEGTEALKEANMWTPAINAGKITGMILDGYDDEECLEILATPGRLGGLMADACEVIYDHEQKRLGGK